MAVRMEGRYLGKLKLRLRHGPSGAEIVTVAPVDNHGDGSSFSPTDLCAVSLGTCMVTVMAIFAEENGIPFGNASFEIEKHMRADPRRIDRLPLTVHMPAGLTGEQRVKLERVGRACPVSRSLHPDVRQEIQFVYPD